MKLKLFGISLIIAGILASTGIAFAESQKMNIPSSFLYQAINKYKNKNYTGCIQDMEYIIKKGRPSDITYYYQALSYAQLGMNDQARMAYEKAASISSNSILVDYSNQAIMCIDDPSVCDMNMDDSDISKFIKSKKFMHADVEQTLQEKALERTKDEINRGQEPSSDNLKYLNQNNAPTDKEIADAVRTLSKLGLNPLNNMNGANYAAYGQNSEMAQLSAFLGSQNNNNGNNMMNLVPMISAMQSSPEGKNRVSKEFLQAYMLNQMLPGLSFGSDDK